MIWLPSLLGFRIRGLKRRFGLWFPLFLLWPFFILGALVTFPVVLLLAILLWPTGWSRTLLLLGPWLFRMFCALRGLAIEFKSGSDRVYILIR